MQLAFTGTDLIASAFGLALVLGASGALLAARIRARKAARTTSPTARPDGGSMRWLH